LPSAKEYVFRGQGHTLITLVTPCFKNYPL